MAANPKWFSDRLTDAGMSQRKLAKMLDIQPSALNRRINGSHRWQPDELAAIARMLGVPLDDVLRNVGVDVPRERTAMVPLHGVVNAAGEVATRGASKLPAVDRPGQLPSATLALRIDAPGDPMDGWAAYYVPSSRLDPEAVGRLAVVVLRDGREFLRVMQRGSERGRWTLRLLRAADNAPAIENVFVESATPVSHIAL